MAGTIEKGAAKACVTNIPRGGNARSPLCNKHQQRLQATVIALAGKKVSKSKKERQSTRAIITEYVHPVQGCAAAAQQQKYCLLFWLFQPTSSYQHSPPADPCS